MAIKEVKRSEPYKLTENSVDDSREKLEYKKPVLQALGDIRSLTLGASIAPYPESGGTFSFTPP